MKPSWMVIIHNLNINLKVMNSLIKKPGKYKLSELTENEMRYTFGGDDLSKAVFYALGVAFKYLEEASKRGAPPTGQQFR